MHDFAWSATSPKKPWRTSRRARCEVRLDSTNEQAVFGESVLPGAGSQHERVLQLARPTSECPWSRWSCSALQRRGPAGTHPRQPSLGQGRIRLATHIQGTAGPRYPGGQRAGLQAHAAARHQGQYKTQVRGDHRQQARPARGARTGSAALQAEGSRLAQEW